MDEEPKKSWPGEGVKAYPRNGEVETLEPADEAEVRLVLATVAEVVAAAGEDFRYAKKGLYPEAPAACTYVWQGQADCLAARVLHRLGMSLEALSYYEGDSCDVMTRSSLNDDERPYAPVGLYALATLRAAQNYQDRGLPWGECLAAARRWASDCYGIEVA